MWKSYNNGAYYLILDIDQKEEMHYEKDGTSFIISHTYYDIMGLEDGKIYPDYTCDGMSEHPNWEFMC